MVTPHPHKGTQPDVETDRVLVIDDDELTRLALARSLKRLGYEVMQASSGELGLQLAESLVPQVIIVDLRMPGIDGHTVLRRLKAAGAASAVVVMSGHGGMDDVVDAMRAGAVDYLKKPWNPTELVAAVARALEVYEARTLLRTASTSTPAADPASPPQVSAPPARALLTPPPPAPAAHPASAPRMQAASSSPRLQSVRQAPTPAPATPKGNEASFKDLLDLLRRGKIPVPPVPKVLREIRSMISRPEVTIDELVVRIEQDQRVAADVVRMANSAAYLRIGKVQDVRSAVSRIGFRQVHAIVETIFVKGFVQSSNPELRAIQQRVWRHSVAFGMAMRGVADATQASLGACPDTGYLAGLLADVGASFLFHIVDERMSAHLKAPGGTQAVVEMVRAHHEEIGADILLQWGFSSEVNRAVAGHHSQRPETGLRPYGTLMPLACALADQVSGEGDMTCRDPREADPAGLAQHVLTIPPDVLTSIRTRLARDFSNMVGNLG